jgi:UDP-glucose 4-epimerase
MLRLYWVAERNNLHRVGIDWLSQNSLSQACEGVDTVVHLAAMNDAECLHDPIAALEINGVNTARLVEAAKVSGVRRFIYVSTAHVYGPRLVGRIDESTLPIGPHPYATSHRAAEDVVLASNAHFVSIVLRLSNGFGVPADPGVNAWMLLTNDLCKQAVTLRSMTLRSYGLQRRDFVTLDDVARVVDHMLELPSTKIGSGLFNVGSGQSMRVIDMVELIQTRCTTLLNFTPEIIRPDPDKNEQNPHLDYRIDRLLKTDFILNGDISSEIDATLLMCNENFNQT